MHTVLTNSSMCTLAVSTLWNGHTELTRLSSTGRTVPELALNTLKTKRNVIFDVSIGMNPRITRQSTNGRQLDCECVIDQKAALDRAVLPSGKEMAHDGFSAENKLGFGSGVISTPSEANGDETFDVAKCNAPGCTQCTDMFDDSSFDLDARTKYVHEEALLERVTEPGEQHLLLLPTRLYGYALHHREWYALNVNTLSEIRSRKQQKDASSAFDDLVLPEKHKKTIRALVKHQTRSFGESSSASHDGTKPAGVPMQGLDLIRGKGRGLIILLHGAPGVGKTSTAESVAIQLKRPLLPITCGDLGTRAEVVEQRLEDFFNLAARWGCVVLLDEADVFLAKRVTGDLERNGLVSVFLRQLEYYSGVLILTTNRVGEFDEAFVSRIHMKLHYPRLDKESTMEIWEMNIRRIRENMDLGIDVKEDGIREFARKYWKSNASTTGRQWNGRQIKNAFQTAVALAYWEWWEEGRKRDKPVLKKSQFKDVCETVRIFLPRLASQPNLAMIILLMPTTSAPCIERVRRCLLRTSLQLSPYVSLSRHLLTLFLFFPRALTLTSTSINCTELEARVLSRKKPRDTISDTILTMLRTKKRLPGRSTVPGLDMLLQVAHHVQLLPGTMAGMRRSRSSSGS